MKTWQPHRRPALESSGICTTHLSLVVFISTYIVHASRVVSMTESSGRQTQYLMPPLKVLSFTYNISHRNHILKDDFTYCSGTERRRENQHKARTT